MARAKRESDELYNARRRAKRAAARLEREIKAGNVKRSRQVTAYQQEIKRQVSQSYLGGRPTEERRASARSAAKSLDKFRVGAKADKVERRNVIFKSNIKAGSTGAGVIPKENVQLFWNATKHAWAGRGRDRYASIQQYYGTNDLQVIFENVMGQNKEALARAKGTRGAMNIEDTSDPMSALQQALGQGVEADGNYPNDFMAYMVPVYNL